VAFYIQFELYGFFKFKKKKILKTTMLNVNYLNQEQEQALELFKVKSPPWFSWP
jgi:hypothetical protein